MSSSETEEDYRCKFLEAVDTTFINDGMFQNAATDVNIEHVIKVQPPVIAKSNRFWDEGENVFQSDINATESMKKCIGKKLSTLIEERFEFVEVDDKRIQSAKSTEFCKIKLLGDCNEFLKITPENTDVLTAKKKRICITKRFTENSETDDKLKLTLAAIAPNDIHKLTKCWSNRPKSKLYEFRKNGIHAILITQKNEFSELRIKNNWNEAKIASFRKTNKR